MKALGQLASGESVYDREKSHLDYKIKPLLLEALTKIKAVQREYIEEEVKFSRIIGTSDMIKTTKKDKIVYARRKNRKGLSRFALNRVPEDSDTLTVVLKKRKEGGYTLITTFIGHITEPEPFSPGATSKSNEFWKTHAFVWGSKEVVEGTESSIADKTLL